MLTSYYITSLIHGTPCQFFLSRRQKGQQKKRGKLVTAVRRKHLGVAEVVPLLQLHHYLNVRRHGLLCLPLLLRSEVVENHLYWDVGVIVVHASEDARGDSISCSFALFIQGDLHTEPRAAKFPG